LSNVLHIAEIMTERYRQLHEELKRKCGSFRQFKSSFDESLGHIAKRASQEKDKERERIRRNLDSRHFAAVIMQGKLRLDECKSKAGLVEVAIEGVFRRFEGMDFETSNGFCCNEVFIRVVVRDTGWRKVLIVTAYPLFDENKDYSTPEVSYEEVWT
jgi:hypothetical protein